MASNFSLTITLGNAAMNDVSAIASALRRTAGLLDESYSGEDLDTLDTFDAHGLIRDLNGARVGEWQITD